MNRRAATVVLGLVVVMFLALGSTIAQGHHKGDLDKVKTRLNRVSQRVATVEATISASPWTASKGGGLNKLEGGAAWTVAGLTVGTLITLAWASIRVISRQREN